MRLIRNALVCGVVAASCGHANAIAIMGAAVFKEHCAITFPAMKADLDAAFRAYAKNSKSAPTRTQLETYAALAKDTKKPPPTQDDCTGLLAELRTTTPAQADAAVADALTQAFKLRDDVERLALEKGQRRAAIGINLQEIAPEPRLAYVVPGGPANLAGLEMHDEILAANGNPVPHRLMLVKAFLETKAGSPIKLKVKREDRIFEVEVVTTTGAEIERLRLRNERP